MNNVSKYREIVKDDGRVSQRELLVTIMQDRAMKEENKSECLVPIDSKKVARLVNPKQYEAINFRRHVRYEIECARVSAGRPIDGRRTGKYKYLQKHIHARSRARDSSGAFVPTKASLPSLCN